MIASNETFIIAAYAVMWIGILGYFWRLGRMEESVRSDHRRVSREDRGEVPR